MPSQMPFPSQSHSFEVFSQYSRFLRSAIADEESLQLGEELHLLAGRIEAMVVLLQNPAPKHSMVATALLELMAALRDHKAVILHLGEQWRVFFEFDTHVAALGQFRTLVGGWALELAKANGQLPTLADFDLAAWRFLGAGKLLLDVRDNAAHLAPSVSQPAPPRPHWRARWRSWWQARKP